MMRRIMHSITTTGNRYASCSGTPAMRCTSWWAPAAVAAASAAAYAASCLTSDTLNVQCESVKKNNAGTKYGDIHPPREVRTESSMLLLSDIDGTLAGTGACDSLARFNKAWDSKHRPRGDILVYNTARPLESPISASGFVDLVAEMRRKGREGLVVPDALVVAEGTEIYYFHSWSSAPTEDAEWDAKMAAQWDIKTVVSVMDPADEEVWFTARENSIDDKYRYGITVKDGALAASLAQEFQALLGDNYIVESIPMTWADGHIIAAIPASGGKGNAGLYLAKKLGVNPEKTVFAADSENDIPMLETGLKGVAVGNSTPGFKAATAGHKSVHTSELKWGDGVLDGLKHFDF